MTVYVLHRYWNTPDNEGDEIVGVYSREASAYNDMKLDVERVKSYYSLGFWEDDATWENTREIHLGRIRGTVIERYATIYGWEIKELEVQ